MTEMNDLSWIQNNLKDVEVKIEAACKQSGRDRKDVKLIAVSKTKPIKMISEVYNSGIEDFGENYVQELKDKTEEVKEPVNWYLIGHLQRNKVKYIVDKVKMIQSVDSYRLAVQIDEEAKKKGITVDILLEVNVAGEESKTGLSIDEVEPLVRQIAPLEHVKVKGLMTIAPFVANADENRLVFRKLRQLSVDIKSKNIDNICMDELSMGMTNDFEVAIQEGATMIRVGTAIFGKRDYSNKEQ